MINVRKLTITAVLTCLAIIIPLYFGVLSVQIPPVFSATLASHVPMFLAMFLGPFSAAFVGIGSALGFLMTKGAVIAARAAMHIFVGITGAVLLRKEVSFTKVVAITSPVHAILEAIVVILLTGQIEFALLTVGVGTLIHHFIDGGFTAIFVKSLSKAGRKEFVVNK
ncbi:ECF transporter S component [Clostridium thermarum]|uniref:ECF transporter S component n=1 Tax=Clostridium thermarum TaxID=1716543 RepID=UPI0013D88FAB|nr:ECF transporter S component [Clostridium thermarum]